MKISHTVSCQNFHPAARPWRKYAGAIPWESITDVSCDLDDITDPLAHFLAEHAPTFCAGGRPHSDPDKRIRCYNGLSEADMMRRQKIPYVEAAIRAYDLESRASMIDDFRLPQAEASDDGVSYWTRAAREARESGAVMIRIGDARFFII